ncbi:MAG TPA: SCO family protein [Steroidobacteraceae bacterium]|jgi:protein SCO1/2
MLAFWLAAFMCHPASTRAQSPAFRLAPWPAQVATPAIRLSDTQGHARTLADFRGSVTVVYFGFLSCPDLCPMTMSRLALALKHIGTQPVPIRVLFITLDPERDSPASLDAYTHAFGPQFSALTGSTAMIDAAAAAFFVEHARVGEGSSATIDHSTGIFVLDPKGRLRVVGAADSTAEDLAHDLKLLAQGTASAGQSPSAHPP